MARSIGAPQVASGRRSGGDSTGRRCSEARADGGRGSSGKPAEAGEARPALPGRSVEPGAQPGIGQLPWRDDSITRLPAPARRVDSDLEVVLEILSRCVWPDASTRPRMASWSAIPIAEAVARHQVSPAQHAICANRRGSMTSSSVTGPTGVLPGAPRLPQPRPPALGHSLPLAGPRPLRDGRGGPRPTRGHARGRLLHQPRQIPRPTARAAEAHRGTDQRPQRGARTGGVAGPRRNMLDRFQPRRRGGGSRTGGRVLATFALGTQVRGVTALTFHLGCRDAGSSPPPCPLLDLGDGLLG